MYDLVLVLSVFFSISLTSAHETTFETKNMQSQEFCVAIDAENLFFDEGRLFLQTEYNSAIPLTSISYLNGRCYTFLSLEAPSSLYYAQGYECVKCGYRFVKTTPGAPRSCPVCGSNDWKLF